MPVTLNANDWTALGKAKRLAVLCRLSVVHLTVISCVSGGLLAAADVRSNALDLRSGPRRCVSGISRTTSSMICKTSTWAATRRKARSGGRTAAIR